MGGESEDGDDEEEKSPSFLRIVVCSVQCAWGGTDDFEECFEDCINDEDDD